MSNDYHKAGNHTFQFATTHLVPPAGTPVTYQGFVVGRVKRSVHDEMTIEIDEPYRALIQGGLLEIVSIGRPMERGDK